jgi:hypothetical protein
MSEEFLKIEADSFPLRMTDDQQELWLRSRPEDELYIAQRAASRTRQDAPVKRRIMAEIDRRVAEKHLLAARAAVPRPPSPWYRDRNFWFGVVSTAATIIGTYFTWKAIR